jgi:putative endonuclease
MAWVYILKCSDHSFYTGSTFNLEKRISEHQNGIGGDYTKKRRPVSLVYCEELSSREEAFLRERQIKGWSRKKKEALNKGNREELMNPST